MKMMTAGVVRPPPIRKNAPGTECIVAAYTALYVGPYTSGISASQTPNREFTLPVGHTQKSYLSLL